MSGDVDGSDEDDGEPTLDEMRSALDGLDESDEDWPDLQWFVADRLHDRYRETGDLADLDDAVYRGRRVLTAKRIDLAKYHANLARMFWDRLDETNSARTAEHAGDDLGAYVQLLEQALSLTGDEPAAAELAAQCRTDLAVGLMYMSPLNRQRAVALWESALESNGLDADARVTTLSNLAEALSTPDATAVERRRAVECARKATSEVTARPDHEASAWLSLANSLEIAHDHADEGATLSEAISAIRRGISLLDPEDDDFPGYVANLASLLRRQARETGDRNTLREADILFRNSALPRVSGAHPDRALVLRTGAAIAGDLAHVTGDVPLMYEAIALIKQALSLGDDQSEETGVGWVNLSAALRDAADRFGHTDLLVEAVEAGRAASAIFSEPGLRRAAALTATGNALRDQYISSGTYELLHDAIGDAEEALQLTPTGHHLFAARQTNLAVLLSDEYTESSSLPHLDRAIALYRDALQAPESEDLRIAERQNDLALALRERFHGSLDPEDLTEALHLAEQAVASAGRDSPAWPGYANNYANALMERYEIDSVITDLDHAIELFNSALHDAQGRAAEESGYHTNLGLALATRAHADTDTTAGDFHRAILHLTQAVHVLPDGHPDLAHRVSNLADVYRQMSVVAQRGSDPAAARHAEAAVDTARQAVLHARDNQSRLLPALANLAMALRCRRDVDPEAVDDDEVLAIQRRAAQLDQVPAAEQFSQSALWAREAETLADSYEAMSAHQRTVTLTTEVAWIGLSVAQRRALLDDMTEALTRAVSFAVSAGHPWHALAWADHVRSVMWRQSLHVRSIAATRDDTERRALSGLVSMRCHTGDDRVDEPTIREQRRHLVHHQAPDLHVAPPDPDAYRRLQFTGTLVLLIPGTDASSALLLDARQQPRTVALPEAGTTALQDQIATLRDGCRLASATSPTTQLSGRHRIFDVLGWLWDNVATHVLDALDDNSADPPSPHTLWWSPLGEFALLPIHAAGRYPRNTSQLRRQGSRWWPCVADHAISTYLPLIIDPNRPPVPRSAAPARLLYVSTDAGTGTLHHTRNEHDAVRRAAPLLERTELIDDAATVLAMRSLIPHHRLLHITAHGHVHDDESLLSGIRLSDGTLTVGDFADCEVLDGELAVLLACDSASGDVQLPNEALHVAGAAHQAGYHTVVAATMPLRDSSAVPVVTAIYDAVSRSPSQVAHEVPLALQSALTALRRDPISGPDPLSWASYALFAAGLPITTSPLARRATVQPGKTCPD